MQRTNKRRQFNGERLNNDDDNNNSQVPIRTLYVAPVIPRIVREIKPYFEKFGEVESMRFHSKNDFQYGFVQFKMAESAKSAMTNGLHRIANFNVKVKAGDLWHQPEYVHEHKDNSPNPLLVAPEQDSPSHILTALNDDCLREVFSYFDLIDLSNAAEVCVRFNQRASEVFMKNHKDLNLKSDIFSYRPIKKNELESILRNFGMHIRSLNIDKIAFDTNVPILRMMSRECLTKLVKLDLSSFTMKGNQKKLRKLFAQLEKLHLHYCEFNNKDLLTECSNLKSLRFEYCDMGGGKCINQKFVMLEEAYFIGSDEFDERTLSNFIKMNPALKKLSILGNDNIMSAEPMQVIAQNLHNLSELEFDETIHKDDTNLTEKIQCLGQLKTLSVLKLDLNCESMLPLVKSLADNKVPIENLKLENGDINMESIQFIMQLKQIKILELNDIEGDVTDEHLIELAKKLTHLQQLHLREPQSEITTIGLKKMLLHANNLSLLNIESIESVIIDIDDYKAMLKTVESRPTKIKLTIQISSNTGEKVNVPDEMMAANRDIFYIDEQIEDERSMSNNSEEYISWLENHSESDGYSDFFYDSDVDSEDRYVFGHGYMNGNLFFLG